jgi:hypothetical protein
MEKFERLSALYVKRLMPPNWRHFGDDVGDHWASLRLFLWGYAYERQGSSPDYSAVACDVMRELESKPFDERAASTAWCKFEQKLNTKNTNPGLNPLCTNHTKYRWKDGVEKTTRKDSAVQLALQLDKPIVAWARDAIASGDLKNVHAKLMEINGVGPKIASLFLRDLAVWYNLVPTQDRQLLQPIDTWEAFVASKMGGDGVPESRHDKCASYIVDQSQKPEHANQGIWYFCTEVAFSSRYLVGRSLENQAYFDRLLRHHLHRLKAGAEAADEFNG